MPEPPYRALRIVLRVFSLLAALGGLLMIFAEKPLIVADLSTTTRGRGHHTAPVTAQGNGRHRAHAQRGPVARFT
jgi:hypothetical protein